LDTGNPQDRKAWEVVRQHIGIRGSAQVVSVVSVDVVEHDRAYRDLSFAESFDRGECVRQHAKGVACNDDGLQVEECTEVGDRMLAIDRSQHTTDTFDDRVVRIGRELANAFRKRAE
jgi:hypothetical protein